MVTARTFSGPRARAARKATTLESIPPDTPTTARANPARWISLRMKRVRISVTRRGLMASCAVLGSGLIALPLDAIEFLDGHQQPLVAGQRRDDPLPADVD